MKTLPQHIEEKLIVNKDYQGANGKNFELDRIIDENVNWDERLRKGGPAPKQERDKLEDVYVLIHNSLSSNGWDSRDRQRVWRECNPSGACEELFKDYDNYHTCMFISWPNEHKPFASKTIERTIDIVKKHIDAEHFDVNYIYNKPRVQIYSIESEKYLYFYSGGARYALVVIGKK